MDRAGLWPGILIIWLYNAHPEWRDHNWMVFQVNRGVMLISLKQYTTAFMVFKNCGMLMIDAGMEGTLDYENVIEIIVQLQYILGRHDLGRKNIEECCGIYEQVYQNDPVRVREQKERLQKSYDIVDFISDNHAKMTPVVTQLS